MTRDEIRAKGAKERKMNKFSILKIILVIVFLIVFIICGIFLTNAIINSDLPDWWKFVLLK